MEGAKVRPPNRLVSVNDGDSNGLANVVTCIFRVSLVLLVIPLTPPHLEPRKKRECQDLQGQEGQRD
jgi:hypothetical protein